MKVTDETITEAEAVDTDEEMANFPRAIIKKLGNSVIESANGSDTRGTADANAQKYR